MSFRKPCHMPFRKLIPPFTLTETKMVFIVSSRYIYFPHMQPSSEFFSCLQKIDSFQFKWMRKIFLVDGAVKHMQNVVRESFSGHRI